MVVLQRWGVGPKDTFNSYNGVDKLSVNAIAPISISVSGCIKKPKWGIHHRGSVH